MKLSEIVPWGRSLAEYAAMFALEDGDRQRRILGCGDGPASFNADWSAAGGNVVSVDPMYAFEGGDIARRFEAAAPGIMRQVRKTEIQWVWTHHRDPAALLESRRQSLHRFLADYDAGRAAGRYLAAALPSLPLEDQSFDLAVCSHLLFLYSGILSEQFHVTSVRELCRVSGEVRIFPLMTLDQSRSSHVEAVRSAVEADGWVARVVGVAYEFQRGGNEMLVLRRGFPSLSSSADQM